MQEPMELNSDENNIQPNIENTQNTDNTANPENINAVPEYNPPQITIPQYSVPQYSVPQYTVPQYQEPQQNTIDNMQQYQPPTYPSFNPEPIVKQQDFNNKYIRIIFYQNIIYIFLRINFLSFYFIFPILNLVLKKST